MKIVTGKEFLKMPEPVLYTYLGDIPEYGCDLLDDNILRVKTYNHTDTDYYVSCALVDLEYESGGKEQLDLLKRGESVDISTAYTSRDYITDDEFETTFYLVYEHKDIEKIKFIIDKIYNKQQINGGDGN